MSTLKMVGLMIALCGAPAAAQDAAPASYGAGVSYRDLDIRGSRGQVQEYNGSVYGRPNGEVSLSNQGSLGLLNLDVRDIGSTEENGSLYLDKGSSIKANVIFNRMTHRQNMTDFGLVVNGTYQKIPSTLSQTLMPPDLNIQYKRTETSANLTLFDPANSARWVSFDYWNALKRGTYPGSYYFTSILFFKEANIDNNTQELAFGLGWDLTPRGALSLDIIHRDFKDDSVVIPFNGGVTAIRPRFPQTEMDGGEMRFRYDASKSLAFTGALTGRQRVNLQSQFLTKSGVAALNAAYKASPTLNLTARLYSRYVEVNENTSFVNIVSNNPPADTHQMDKFLTRGEFAASWQALKSVLVKADYKLEATHRRDAPEEVFGAAGYADGTFVYDGQQANSVATDVTRHLLNAGVKIELPFEAQLDADYHRIQANHALFVNQPTRSDEAGATLTVPLPARLSVYLIADYINERNAVQMTNYHQTRDAYRGGLDWEAANKVFVGMDGSYDTARYTTNGWFGAAGGNANPALSGFEHIEGMYNKQSSTTGGIHGRVNLPKGFVVRGYGSYTWSVVQTPVNYTPKTDPNLHLGDMTPGDVRIARGSVGVEYTPPSYKYLTARASYRIDDWVDHFDVNNSGRASYTEVGLSAKF